MKRIIAISLTICCIASLGVSQSLELEPFGASPRDVASDTTGDPNFLGILDHAYNALLNVGVETEMYFNATFEDSFITDITWTVTSAPTGSIADFGTPVVVGTDTEIASFVPDVVGTYVLTVSEGASSASVTVNAGTYLGVETGSPNCSLCHNDKFTAWQGTGHYEMFETKMTTPGYYASYCISCHNTGYDTEASNNGFDDRTQYVYFYGVDTTFVFPNAADLYDYYGIVDSTRNASVWDSLLVFYPNSMELARIQCESCHGPGSAHYSDVSDNKMVATIDVKNCALCHDSGTHHVYPDQWKESGHAQVPPYPGGSRTYCDGCHNGSQFIQYVNGEDITVQPPANITCAVCHDPHSAENDHQLRTVEATLADGTVMTEGGLGKLCMNCHHQRRSNVDEYSDEPHSHYGPHYGPQADMLMATNAITFGRRLPSSPHLSAIENACVDCHMYPAHVDDEGNVIHMGGHSFSMMQGDTLAHVEACEGCHGDVGESFSEKPYYFNGNADHDGDGIAEGVQEEVHGLMEELAWLLPPANSLYDPHDDVDETWTRTELKAAFNYDFVYYDHSYGIHNPAYTVALLKVSIQALEDMAIAGEIVAIEDIPNDQGYNIRVVWENIVDDVTDYDPVTTYIVKRFDDFGAEPGWTNVGEVTADGSARYALQVATVFNNVDTDTAWTEFKIVAVTQSGVVLESMSGEGFSEDNLIPQAPVNLLAIVSNLDDVELTWEATNDPDINFYRVFRSTQPGFPADETTEIASTTDLFHNDFSLDEGTYYYKVSAVDFSHNFGEISTEISAEIVLSIDANALPIEYALTQNFPNPFNPITTIRFALPENGLVTLTVYNSLGQVVNELINKDMEAGRHSITFSGDNMPSGMYFYSIRVNGFTETKKMILLK